MGENEHLDGAKARQLAETLGLKKLTPEHLQQLLKAESVSAKRRSLMNTSSLTPADEPALVFRLP